MMVFSAYTTMNWQFILQFFFQLLTYSSVSFLYVQQDNRIYPFSLSRKGELLHFVKLSSHQKMNTYSFQKRRKEEEAVPNS